jgi:hypothetical protein
MICIPTVEHTSLLTQIQESEKVSSNPPEAEASLNVTDRKIYDFTQTGRPKLWPWMLGCCELGGQPRV